jgi:rod shape-determining protein MreB
VPFEALGRLFGQEVALDPGSESTKALAREGELVVVPSLVARAGETASKILHTELVGQAAVDLERRSRPETAHPGRWAWTRDDIRILKPIVRGGVADADAAELLFAHVLREARSPSWGARPSVLCGVGAGATPVEQRALADALDRAGAKRVRLAPALAACALAIERGGVASEGGVHFIVELGAERTGMGLASRSGVLASSCVHLGARDLDTALAGRLRREGLMLSREEAGELRKGLGLPAPVPPTHGRTQPEASEASIAPDTIRDAEDVLPRHVGEALAPFLAFLADEMRALLARAPEGASEDLVERGVVLAGGAAATPGLADHIAADLGLPVRVAPDPATLRVRGLVRLLGEPTLLGETAVEL